MTERMRVVLVHNFYARDKPSGENRAVEFDRQLLREAGVDVSLFGVESDDARDERFGNVRHAADPLWSVSALRAFTRMMGEVQPDIVHVHNVYPLISPGVLGLAARDGCAVIATLHNHRLRCVNGLFTRDGQLCRKCVGTRLPWPAVRYRCWDRSVAKSFVVASSLALHENAWRKVDRFIAVSQTLADEVIGDVPGLPPIVVRPNPVPAQRQTAAVRDFLYCGRLDEAKGVSLLLEAWRLTTLPAGWKLHVVGDGPLRSLVEDMAAERSDVSYLGPLSEAGVRAARESTAISVVPSLAPETQGLAVAEAFAAGQPVVVTDRGALPEQVDPACGWVCQPYPDELGAALSAAASAPLAALSAAAVAQWRDRFEPGQSIRHLVEIYTDTIALARQRRTTDGG